jgi:hypothetical protein
MILNEKYFFKISFTIIPSTHHIIRLVCLCCTICVMNHTWILNLNICDFNIYDFSTVMIRHVHGSVRFGLNHKNQPNQVTHIFKNSNRTELDSGSN